MLVCTRSLGSRQGSSPRGRLSLLAESGHARILQARRHASFTDILVSILATGTPIPLSHAGPLRRDSAPRGRLSLLAEPDCLVPAYEAARETPECADHREGQTL